MKPTNEFSADRSKSSGFLIRCKECDNARYRAYYQRVKGRKVLERAAARRQDPPKICARCGIWPTVSSHHRYCVSCRDLALEERATRRYPRASMSPEQVARARERERLRQRNRPTPWAMGYDTRHRKLREAVRVQVDAGMALCARCGVLIVPGEPWDLGHDDSDRRRYSGPEHRACNRATNGRQVTRFSRSW